MNTPIKLVAFGAILATSLAASFGVGSAVGPVRTEAASHHPATDQPMAADLPGGLMVSQAGYTVQLDTPTLPAGTTTVGFRITGPGGDPVTDYTPTHDKDLHLIAVRRDTTGFQHVHPTRDSADHWSAPVDLTPGTWRFFADFRPATLASAITLGVDAEVGGTYEPRPLPQRTTTATVDGYTVALTGDLTAGATSDLTFTVTRDGHPVSDLEPYLAAYGHLVALRVGDLAYLHVHPTGTPGDGTTPAGPTIGFGAAVPTAGTYRLYLDFQHAGAVHTAEFTVDATASGAPTPNDDHGTTGH